MGANKYGHSAGHAAGYSACRVTSCGGTSLTHPSSSRSQRYVLLSSCADWIPVHVPTRQCLQPTVVRKDSCLEFHGWATWALGSPLPGLAGNADTDLETLAGELGAVVCHTTALPHSGAHQPSIFAEFCLASKFAFAWNVLPRWIFGASVGMEYGCNIMEFTGP